MTTLSLTTLILNTLNLNTITTITAKTLTLKSGNFGTVFLDNGYYNKAIAASPVHALPGYILGGLSWFAIPWLTATTMGLAGVALETNPAFPTYPERMTDAEVSAGLVLPYAAVALLGKGGAVATLLIVFMAVTSATSSELIATSSIFTYDLYRTYFNPEASGKRLIYMSHILVVAYALFISTFSVGLWYAGISMGYLYVMMGVIISSAVLPATLTLVWAGQNKWAAGLSPILGLAVALIAWLVTAKKDCGSLDVACTGSNNPMLAGNVAALLSPVVFIPILTLIFGMDHYDWKSMLAIRKGDDHDVAGEAGVDLEETVGGHEETAAEFEEEQRKLERAGKISKIMTVVMVRPPLLYVPHSVSNLTSRPSPSSSSGPCPCTAPATSSPRSSSPAGSWSASSGSSAPSSASACSPSLRAASRSPAPSSFSSRTSPASRTPRRCTPRRPRPRTTRQRAT